MDEKHKIIIQKNYSKLIREVNINELLPRLLEKGVFSDTTVEPYQNLMKTEKDRKRELFANLHRRGPKAFDKLIASLKEINDHDHYILANLLEGKELSVSLGNQPSNNQNVNNSEPTINEEEEQYFNNVSNLSPSGTKPFQLTENQRPQHIRQLSEEVPYARINLTDEPLKINVQKAKRFYDNPHDSKVGVYPMRSRCRGAYLGINNMEFVNHVAKYRAGAQVDEENLKELFKQMGFDISSYRNLTKYDMLTTIKNFANAESNPILKRADCIVVAVMSHGEEGDALESSQVITHDAQLVATSWIVEQFDNLHCPVLRNKPKIFLFQICRGDRLHPGVPMTIPPPMPMSSRLETDGWNSTRGYRMRGMTDMLLAFSTLPGDRSYRDTKQGTWYVQLLCNVFMRHAHDTDVEHLLKMVDSELEHLLSDDGNMQTSTYEARAFKVCYFHPGLYS